METRVVRARDTADLRQRVLRPFLTVEEVVAQGDGSPGIGVYEGDRCLGCANVIEEPMPEDARPGDWRLRGMASDPDVRGQGYGAAALLGAIGYARERGARRIWCNARGTARGFYEHHGFAVRGEAFDIDLIGPHYVMWLDL